MIIILCGLCHGAWQGEATDINHPFDCHILTHLNIKKGDKSDLIKLKEGHSMCGYWKGRGLIDFPVKYNLPITKKAIWIIYSDKQSNMRTMEEFESLENISL